MFGFNIAEAGHVAVIEVPQNISAQSSAAPINPAISMKNYKHVSFLVIAGAEATQDATTLLVFVCSTAAGTNPIAIPFTYYFQALGGAGNDVLSGKNNALAAGLVLAAGNWPPSGLIVIEIDDAELEAATGGALTGSLGVDAYVGIGLGAPVAADFAAVVAVLSGARYSNPKSPSVTV